MKKNMMKKNRRKMKVIFRRMIRSDKTGGLLLILCTLISVFLANSFLRISYESIWHFELGPHSVAHWINDGLMAIFFLMVGLELLQEIYEGELSNIRRAMLPLSGALGGMLIPAAIYLFLNRGAVTQNGFGIPMATDIAFALGVLAILGNRVPLSLKVFLAALAVVDDLGAILLIAIFYTSSLSWGYLAASLLVFVLLLILNKKFHVTAAAPYLIGGLFMWYFMLNSGVHATIAGVLLAVTIPFSKGKGGNSQEECLSVKLQHALQNPVRFMVLPLFALSNTAIAIEGNWRAVLGEPFALGILAGLVLGKPLGIFLFSYLSVKIKLCAMPQGARWRDLLGVGMIGGIGFTMSIFIALLAFEGNSYHINGAKLMILFASLVSGIAGYIWLSFVLPRPKARA